MTPEQLVYRSIGIPDVLQAENKPRAAGHRLAVAAGLDVERDPNVSYESQTRLADAESVVRATVDLVASGALDGAIAGFGHRDDDSYVHAVVRKLELHVYENGRACAGTLLRLVRAYIEQHPFEDDSGRPFR